MFVLGRGWTFFLTFLFVWAFVASTSFANPKRVGILSVEIGGSAPAALRDTVHKSVALGVKDAGNVIIPLSKVSKVLRANSDLAACVSSSCLDQLTKLLGCSRFIRIKVDADGANYNIAVELLSSFSRDKRLRSEIKAECTVCTLGEMLGIVRSSTKRILTMPADKLVVVVFDSIPAGAKFRVEKVGAVVGNTIELKPGEYNVQASKPGRMTVTKKIIVEEGKESQRFTLKLPPAVVVTKSEEKVKHRPFRMWKWVTAGAASVSIISSLVYFIYNKKPSCDRNDGGECALIYNTASLAWITLAGGVSLGGLSGWMFMRDSKDQQMNSQVGASIGLKF